MNGSSRHRREQVMLLCCSTKRPLPSSPSFRTPLQGESHREDPELDVLLADQSASALVATPADTVTDVLLARQRFLAETLAARARAAVETTAARHHPAATLGPVTAVGRRAGDRHPAGHWLNPVSLDEAVRPSAPTVARVAPTIPTASLDRQLPAAMVSAAQTGADRQPPTGRDPYAARASCPRPSRTHSSRRSVRLGAPIPWPPRRLRQRHSTVSPLSGAESASSLRAGRSVTTADPSRSPCATSLTKRSASGSA